MVNSAWLNPAHSKEIFVGHLFGLKRTWLMGAMFIAAWGLAACAGSAGNSAPPGAATPAATTGSGQAAAATPVTTPAAVVTAASPAASPSGATVSPTDNTAAAASPA